MPLLYSSRTWTIYSFILYLAPRHLKTQLGNREHRVTLEPLTEQHTGFNACCFLDQVCAYSWYYYKINILLCKIQFGKDKNKNPSVVCWDGFREDILIGRRNEMVATVLKSNLAVCIEISESSHGVKSNNSSSRKSFERNNKRVSYTMMFTATVFIQTKMKKYTDRDME